MPTPAEQRAIQGDKAVLKQAASPPENKVIVAADGLPRVHRVADRLLEDFWIPPERLATAAAPDLQRGLKAAFKTVAQFILRKPGQLGCLLGRNQHVLSPPDCLQSRR